jgi:hypothetical protein
MKKNRNVKDKMNELEREKQDLVSRYRSILKGLYVMKFIGKGSE